MRDYDELQWDEDMSDESQIQATISDDSFNIDDDIDCILPEQKVTLPSDFLPKIPVRHKKKSKSSNKEKKKEKKKAKHKSGKAGLKERSKNSKIKPSKNKKFALQLQELFNFEDRQVQTPYILALNYARSNDILVYNNEILLYDPVCGFYKAKSKTDIKREILAEVPLEKHSKIKNTEITSAFESLLLNNELQSDLKPIQNKPFINCLSGVVDAQEFVEYPHSTKYGFTDCIQARFDPDANGEEWEKFMQTITMGDKQLYKLIQEAFGYALSTYSNARVMFIVFGPSTTGKSLILAILRNIIGEDLVSSVTIQQLEKQEYVAEMNGKKINIAADLPNTPLGDVGTLEPDEGSCVLKTDVAKAFYAAAADAGLPKPPKTEIYNCLEQMGITGVKETVEGLGQQWIFRGIHLK